MGGIYPKPEKSAPNSRNGSGFPNDNQQLNEANFPNVFHPNTLGSTSRPSHNDYGAVFARTLASGLPNNQSSFSIPGQRPNNKSCEDIVNYRYMTDSATFQPRNMSMSPNTVLQNQIKHQNYTQANLMSTLNQNRSAAVLHQFNAAKNESFQGTQMMQSGSKLNVDVSNRPKPSNYNQQHSQQSGIFPPTKRPQLISQPPHKRSRLTNDFVNMTHHSPSNIQQSHHLSMNQQDSIRLSSSPQKFGPKDNIYKGSLMNQTKSNLLDHRGIWQNKEPAYYPQVEAISPVPEDMKHCDFKTLTEKDDIGEKLSVVNADIIKQEQNISRLQEKIESLNSKINEPCIENDSKEESIITISRDPIQSIITENQRKATEQHQVFNKLCSTHVSWSPLALPLYRQQGDVDLLVEVKAHFHKTFKPHLIKYIRRRKFADKARIRFLADSYQLAAKAWYKRLDKTLNSAKRRQKESKFRELFEKTFPEIKRNREERENGDYNDPSSNTIESSSNVSSAVNNHRCLNNNFNVTSVTDNQRPTSPYDAVKEMEKMKEYAIDPPLTMSTWYKSKNLIEYGSLIKDPKSQHNNFQNYKPFWSREEIDIFKEQYIITPKNFARIASFLSKKTVSNCVHYYYLTKKSVNYKSLVKKHARRRRDKAERQQRYHQAHHTAGDINIPQTTDSIDGSKLEPMLSKNFIEYSTLIKEEQRNDIYNQDNDCNQEIPKEHGDSKGNVTMDDNKSSSSTTAKNNKNNGSSCSERNSLSKSHREPDNDDEDDNYRRHFSSEFSRDSDTIRTFESIRLSSNENDRNKITDNNCENEFNCSRQLSDLPNIGIGIKHDAIHIKEAIEYSIEQNLSQNVEKSVNKGTLEKKLYQGVARTLDPTSEFPRPNIDESVWKKNNTLENLEYNPKYGSYQQKNEDLPVFKEANRESGNSDSPMKFNSSVNRAILMKDFCTAQMMNQSPMCSSVNSKLQPVSYPASNSEHCVDPSLSIAPELLPKPEPYKPKIASVTESIDPYMNNIVALSKATNPSMKKSDFFIDRVSKLYEEEVEPYTDEFRNRSDSQRTRTSSEASEMYAYIKIRNQKNIPSTKRVALTNSLNEKAANTTVDSRIKMPPPDVTDQKVFRTQKSSFSSKNPYLKSNSSKESVLTNDNCHNTKLSSDDVASVTANCSESNLKRKIITAANIIDSLIDKHTTNDTDVKVLSNSFKAAPEKSFTKFIDLSDDKFKNTLQMTLDGHIKQLIVDDYDSTRRGDQNLQNATDAGRGSTKSRHEIPRHKYHNVPLKKRDKSSGGEYGSSPARAKVGPKPSNDVSNGPSKPIVEKNNNSITYKDKLDYSIADSYDSQSPQFNSPGKLLIDLDNNAEGF